MPATFFSEYDQWVTIGDDGLASVGLTTKAVLRLGEVVAVELPEPGRSIVKGEACGKLKRGDVTHDILAPLTGTVSEANTALVEDPSPLAHAPQSAWLFKMRLADPGAFAELMDQAAYDVFSAKP